MSTAGFDARRFKAQERAGLNRIAEHYDEGATLRVDLQRALLDDAALQCGERVLDLASGPGLLARDAAAQVGDDGRLVASDIAEAMLAVGQRRATADGLANLLFAAADAEHLPFADDHFDAVLLGLGLFMFPHPERALAEIRRVLRPGGRLVLSVWGPREAVPLISHAQDCIARILPKPKVERPSVFRFGHAGPLELLLRQAGFGEVSIAEHRLHCHFPSHEAYWQAFLALAGGAAEAIGRLDDALRQRLASEVAGELEACRSADGFHTDSLVLVASARR